MIRLHKYLARCGVASLRESEKLILSSKIKVNGEIINTMGFEIDEDNDIVTYLDKKVKLEEKVYYLINKPKNTICSQKDTHNRLKVSDLIPTAKRIYCVGRLDYNTTGALILTNDGQLANRIAHPSNMVIKRYVAIVDKKLQLSDFDDYQREIIIEDVAYHIHKIEILSNKQIAIWINEGHNHEIKNLLLYFGYYCIELHRTHIGNLSVENLKFGEYTSLTLDSIIANLF